MNVEALRQLQRVVEAAPEENFNMNVWRRDSALKPVIQMLGGCGTAACAVGWAGQDEWFNLHGFSTAPIRGREFTPMYQDLMGGLAVMKFFDLDAGETHRLFYPGSYKNPKGAPVTKQQVLFRIMQMIERHEQDEDSRRRAAETKTVSHEAQDVGGTL